MPTSYIKGQSIVVELSLVNKINKLKKVSKKKKVCDLDATFRIILAP